jgi:hypothetical protein
MKVLKFSTFDEKRTITPKLNMFNMPRSTYPAILK